VPGHYQAILTNRYARFPNWWEDGGADDPEAGLDSYFCFQPMGWQHMPAARAGHWDGFISLMDGDIVGTGLFLHQWDKLAEAGFTFDVEDRRVWSSWWDEDGCSLVGKTPHQWQRDAAEFMRLHSNGGGLIVAPTGTGKTLLAAWAFHRLRGRGIFVVDDTALGMQTQIELEELLGETVGFVGDGKFSIGRVTVCLVQSLHRNRNEERYRQLARVSLMLIDEVHVALNNRMDDTLAGYLPQACFGLTATLNLENPAVAFPAYALCGKDVFTYTSQQARDEGHITQCYAYLLSAPRLAEALHEESYGSLYKRSVVQDEWINTFGASLAVQATAHGYTVVVLVRELEHLDAVATIWEQMGVDFLEYSGRERGKVRTYMRHRLTKGTSNLAVATTGTMTKGTNIPRLSFIIDLAQSKKWENTVQRAGRGSRIVTGKDHFVYVDISQASVKVRGIRKRNIFAGHASQRRAGLRAQGYKIHTRALESTIEPQTEAAHVLNFILEGS